MSTASFDLSQSKLADILPIASAMQPIRIGVAVECVRAGSCCDHLGHCARAHGGVVDDAQTGDHDSRRPMTMGSGGPADSTEKSGDQTILTVEESSATNGRSVQKKETAAALALHLSLTPHPAARSRTRSKPSA